MGKTQPVRTHSQTRRPDDDAMGGLALRDTRKPRHDFPAQRQGSGLAELGRRWLTRPNHHRLVEKPVRYSNRQRIDDDFQRRGARHMAVTLTVDKFGLDSEVFGFGVKVHSARGLHATARDVAKFSRCRNRIAVVNSPASPPFPGNQYSMSGLVYRSGASPFPQTKRDVFSM